MIARGVPAGTNKPVHELLGTAHERLPRYASGGMGDSTDRLELA